MPCVRWRCRFLAFYFPQVAAPVYSFLGPFLAVYKSSPFASLAIYLALIYVGRTNAVSRFGTWPGIDLAAWQSTSSRIACRWQDRRTYTNAMWCPSFSVLAYSQSGSTFSR